MKTTNAKNTLNQEVIDATAKLTVSRGYVCRRCSTKIIEEARSRGVFRGRIAYHFRGDKGYGTTCARCGQKVSAYFTK